MDTRYWTPDTLEKRSQVLASLVVVVGTGWAVFLLIQFLSLMAGGIGGVLGYLILFGPGWLVYIGLARRAFGATAWKDPTALWWACIGINSIWAIIFTPISIDSPSLRSILTAASATASIVLSVAGLRLERLRVAELDVGADQAGPRLGSS